MLGERQPRTTKDAKEIIGRIRTSSKQASLHFFSRLAFLGWHVIHTTEKINPHHRLLFPQLITWLHTQSFIKRDNWVCLFTSLMLPIRFLCTTGGPQWLHRLSHLTNWWVRDATQKWHGVYIQSPPPLTRGKKKLHHSYYNSVLINNAHATHKNHSIWGFERQKSQNMSLFTKKAPVPQRCYLERQGCNQYMINWFLPCWLGNICPSLCTMHVASDCGSYKH